MQEFESAEIENKLEDLERCATQAILAALTVCESPYFKAWGDDWIFEIDRTEASAGEMRSRARNEKIWLAAMGKKDESQIAAAAELACSAAAEAARFRQRETMSGADRVREFSRLAALKVIEARRILGSKESSAIVE